MPFINEEHIIQFGKYKGQTIESIITTQPEYIQWLKTQYYYQLDPRLMELVDSHKPNKDVLLWGRHKGRSVKQISEIDPAYIIWLKCNKFVQENCKSIMDQINELEEAKKELTVSSDSEQISELTTPE